MSIAISVKFMEAFSKLPDSVQKRTIEFMERFEANPHAPGFNYETINAVADKKIRSVRINDTYRAILKREEETGTYILLWVDHHDEAYEWAASRKCEVNPVTGKIQIFSVQEINEIQKNEEDMGQGVFSCCSDDDLLVLGVPERQIKVVKSISSYNVFCNCKHLLPDDVVENLEWIANGIPVEEVVELARSESHGSKVESLGSALNSGASNDSFVIVDGQEELRKVMNGSLEKWRVFLHPAQRDVVDRDYAGPARVLGEAGTGKTVVAMHRTKRLSNTIGANQKVLFTTFTTNLADDICSNLKKICSTDELSRIEVVSIDAWVTRFLSNRRYEGKVIYGNTVDEYWDKAISIVDYWEFSRDFYKEEWVAVVAPNEAYTREKYLTASRVGRGTGLDRSKRIAVWTVFEKYIDLTKKDHVMDIDSAMFLCRRLIEEKPVDYNYPCVVVDEGQDFSSNAYMLIRAIAGQEHKNDIFIVGDSHQRIYRRKAVLSHCGINIKGRSSHLKINYRTTEEIRKYAYSILTGLAFDDLDGNLDTGRESRSFTHGPEPLVRHFSTKCEEVEYVCNEVHKLIEKGISANNVCIVARTSRLLDDYVTGLGSMGIRTFEIKQNKVDDRERDGIRIATMHRVKGLEFKYVFVVAANRGTVPLETAIDHTDRVSELETLKAERCLVYVALTRTQKCAYISSYGKRSEILPKV